MIHVVEVAVAVDDHDLDLAGASFLALADGDDKLPELAHLLPVEVGGQVHDYHLQGQ